MQYICLALYFGVSAVHLIFSWKDDPKIRAMTKPFLLFFLLIYYLLAASSIRIVTVIALFTSWIGDLLLIHKGHAWFTAGGISFLISHLFFIFSYVDSVVINSHYLIIPFIALGYFAVGFLIMKSVKNNTPRQMVIPMFLYLVTNSTMNVFAMMQLLSRKNIGALVAYCGAFLFFISDCTLFLVRYHKNRNIVPKKHFGVMLTYLLGEFLIVQGLILIAK